MLLRLQTIDAKIMKLLAILAAIGIEQWRTAGWRRDFENLYIRYLRRLEVMLSGGGTWLATLLALLPFLAVLLIDQLLMPVWWLWLLWSVLALYLMMGFRHFSHYLTQIREALNEGDLPTARQALYEWQGGDSHSLSSNEIAARAIESGALAVYRNVFGILFWFFIFGASGAAFYWMLAAISREWVENLVGEDVSPVSATRAEFGRAARWLLFLVDWLPVRCLAFTFAIVGDFENAIYQWRALPDDYGLFDSVNNQNVLLATGMGALGLSWMPAPVATTSSPSETKEKDTRQTAEDAGNIAPEDDGTVTAPEKSNDDLGEPPSGAQITPGALPSAFGLSWRALLFWLLVIAIVTVAS
ncbi:MAG: regulatory signaling modulator protein AmpE [Burkholderiales bacterium]|jgi:adenosylcobinamide-phosphate synthase|nr:regulatory signaling modulator protein AmpE [Burkholderiales bacterium]